MKLFYLIAVFFVGEIVYAQIPKNLDIPLESQRSSVVQQIGLTEIHVNYHSPGKRGRELFGKEIPYGRIWRAGANENTLITVSKDIQVEGEWLKAGRYGLHMIPDKEQWTIIFSSDNEIWGSFGLDTSKDALRVNVKPEKMEYEREWLNYQFWEKAPLHATLLMEWGSIRIPIRLEVTKKSVVDDFRQQLRSSAAFKWEGTYHAALYCFNNNINLEEALEWAERSVQALPNFQNMKLKSDLLARLEKTDEAAFILEKSYEYATPSDYRNQVGFMVSKNELDAAEKLALKGTKKYSDNWLVFLVLGNVYAAKGDKNRALKNYSLAMNLTTENNKAFVQRHIDRL